jgi:Pentapeptide repeats (8 copies)
MKDYLTEGKKKGSLEPYDVPEDEAYLANEVHDNLCLIRKNLRRGVFINLALKAAEIEECDFSFSIFINCYFRGANFRGCNFTGSKFYECNFRSATLIDCKLLYTKWKETYIGKETVLANLPSYPNVAQELLINLRMNSTSIGEYDDARAYLYESEALSRVHLRNIVTQYSQYYKKYGAWSRTRALFSLLQSYAERFFWGYGEKPGTLLISALAIVSAFSVIYLIKLPLLFGLDSPNPNLLDAFLQAEKLSVLAFSGNTPNSIFSTQYQAISTLLTAESLFGLVFIAFLAASLHRKISTRRA